jgi:hypothetical protein
MIYKVVKQSMQGYFLKELFGNYLTYQQLNIFSDQQLFEISFNAHIINTRDNEQELKSIQNVVIINRTHIYPQNLWNQYYDTTFHLMLRQQPSTSSPLHQPLFNFIVYQQNSDTNPK